jgi:hypothetical protein
MTRPPRFPAKKIYFPVKKTCANARNFPDDVLDSLIADNSAWEKLDKYLRNEDATYSALRKLVESFPSRVLEKDLRKRGTR